MIKVAHVIKSLERGGAETVLRRLIEGADPDRFCWEVVSLTSVGPIGRDLRAGGTTVHVLETRGPLGYATAIPRLANLFQELRPDVVQTWMYHGELIGGLAARLAGSIPTVWAVHAGSPPLEGASTLERVGLRANAFLSRRLPARIICCSHTTERVHASLGYDRTKMIVVPNGFAVSPVEDDVPGGLQQELPVILRVGRDHPDKDIPTFLRALRHVRHEGAEIRGLLVGPGLHRGNQDLVELVRQTGLSDHVDLLGPRDDVARLLRVASVAVSSSSGGEGLPLVVGEAMAAGTPVITTDVGDSALVVDDPARVVDPGDHQALARAIKRVLDLPVEERRALGERDKKTVVERWNLKQMIQGYCDEYVRVASHERQNRGSR